MIAQKWSRLTQPCFALCYALLSCYSAKENIKLILSGLQVFRGLLHLFPACTGKWCLKCQANQRCHFVKNYIP